MPGHYGQKKTNKLADKGKCTCYEYREIFRSHLAAMINSRGFAGICSSVLSWPCVIPSIGAFELKRVQKTNLITIRQEHM